MDPLSRRIFKYRKSLLPNAYLASLEKGVKNVDEAMSRTGFTIGYPGWNLLYYSVLSNMQDSGDNLVIETGANVGCSTIILAQALKDSGLHGHVYSVEIEKANYLKAKNNIEKAGLAEFVSLACGDSIDFLNSLLKEINVIRFAFLDGCHDEGHVIKEFDLIYPKLANESMVFFDNTYKIADEGEDQRVNGALRRIKAKYGGNLINFEYTSWFTPGQALWQKNAFAKDWK
jgi:predicted O-methyltransferase YrrM